MKTEIRPFHLAFPVYNIDKTIKWYIDILNCSIGRQSRLWVDFNFFGHQISAHKIDKELSDSETNPVDGHNVPSRHFGIVMKMEEWKSLLKRLNNKKIKFIIEPNIRFKDEKGEQSTFFIQDPSENVLEFKAFKNDQMIFEN
jgi:extradiol dioxygenase family protein